MSRIYRELSDMTKMKISQAMKGKSKSDAHKKAISIAMKEYWSNIPFKNNDITTRENE